MNSESPKATGLIADKGIELLTYGTPNGISPTHVQTIVTKQF
jgi:hypothetical protein